MTLNDSNVSASSTNGGGWESAPVAVEAYSVVLSVAALVLAALLGGGGSLSVLLAIFQSQRVRKYSYTLVLVFFFLCCGLDLLWAPMELAHLLTYHHSLRNPTLDFGVATFAVYIFLSAGLAILIAAFCAENVLRVAGCFGHGVRQAWPASVCVAMFLTSLLLTVAFLSASLGHQHQGSYLILHPDSAASRLSTLIVLLLMVGVGVVGVVVARVVALRRGEVKSSESFLSAQSNESANAVPNFLINQTDVAASSEDGDKLSISASSSKLPDIIGPDVTPSTPVKGHNSPRLGNLPAPGQRGPAMLGVNMAQVLGRRRHTICQIGDSSNPPDPITKAKQYNYVRKFSVDISALQAQLENPKLFKDTAPFVSDQDLRQRQQQQQNKPKLPEARGPLLPLPSLGPRQEGGEAGSLKLSLPTRPPVITVSEEVKEDVEGEIEEEEGEKEEGEEKGKGLNSTTVRTEYTPIVNKAELTNIPRLPVTCPVDEEEEEEEEEEEREEEERVGNPCGEEDASYKSASNDNRLTDCDQDFVKMTLLMTLTFFLCTFPLLLIEAMKDSVNAHTYVNISTCTRALSSIQTIIYPHIVTCMDSVVNKAVNRLKVQFGRACALRDGDCIEMQPDPGSSSTSQM